MRFLRHPKGRKKRNIYEGNMLEVMLVLCELSKIRVIQLSVDGYTSRLVQRCVYDCPDGAKKFYRIEYGHRCPVIIEKNMRSM